MTKKTSYKSMVERIKRAQKISDIDKLGDSLDRLYLVGVFTPSELMRLDSLLMDLKHTLKES